MAMTDKDIMKLLIKLFDAASQQLSLLEKDREVCKKCAEMLKQQFFGKKRASYAADVKKKIINLAVTKIAELSMSDSLKHTLLSEVNEVRKKAGLDEDVILKEIIDGIFFI